MTQVAKSDAPIAFSLSDEQVAIATSVRTGKTNILVQARAGTGKTFLLRSCVPLMNGAIAVCAYNTKIAKEIREKINADGYLRSQRTRLLNQPGVDVGTFHSFGWSVIRKLFPKIRIEGLDKDNAGFYKFTVIADRLNIPKPLRTCTRKAMDRAQERGFGILFPLNDVAQWLDLADHYGLSADLPEDGRILAQTLGINPDDWQDGLLKLCLRYAAKAITMSLTMVTETFKRDYTVGRNNKSVKGEEFIGVISFGEMLYLPLVWNMPFPQYDWVLVDEAQDSNPIRREMAKRMLAAGGRMMWVGDNRQSINGWTGADNNALQQITEQFCCKTFPMTVTFRCSKAVVRRAQQLVPDYKAAASNPEGEEITVSEDDFHKMELFTSRENGSGDAIICRNTKPLVVLAYKLIGRGVACHVEGKDIGKGIMDLLGRWPHLKTLSALTDKLDDYREREVAKLMAKNQEIMADQLSDKCETIAAIIAGLPKGSNVEDLVAQVNSLFADTNGKPVNTVTLLTAHRSKGLEYSRVFCYGMDKFIPSKYATQDWQIEQETNLLYVAITRAINTLVNVQVA